MRAAPLVSWLQTVALFSLVFLLMLAMGAGFGAAFGELSLAWFVAWAGAALALNAGIYFLSDTIMLRSYGVEIVSAEQQPDLHRIVADIARRAEVPVPRVGIIDAESANAFATGRNPNHSVVCVTKGLLLLLTEEELRGVIAHEISHVANRDTLVKTTAATVASFFAYGVPIAVLTAAGRRRVRVVRAALTAALAYSGGVVGAAVIKAFVSRSREYRADADAAQMLGDTRGLESALPKVEASLRGSPLVLANEASSHMFIVSPLTDEPLRRLFAAHPPVAKRLERLRGLAVQPPPPGAPAIPPA